jgi:tRNA G10  N-methylase Trm11
MPTYAAFIGHQPHISLAELSATLPGFKLQKIVDRSAVIFESSAEIDMKYLGMLGGTVVIAKSLDKPDVKLEDVPALMQETVANVKGKVTFSLRTQGVAPVKVRELYKKTKDALRKKGQSSRYVGSENKAAPSIVLHQNDMLSGKHGAELVVIAAKDFLWIGKTVAAQDIESYAKRDVEKPVRDTTAGLLPPKLAQILLNLGAWLVREDTAEKDRKPHSKEKLTVLDPFCGTGVIPIECLLRGWNIYASDISQKAITGTTKNLEWIRKEEKILKRDVESEVWKHDALKPFDLKEEIDVIVTETMLGPGIEERPTVKDIAKMKSENEVLQKGFLENMAKCFPGVPVVATWPVWYHKKDQVRLEKIWAAIDKIGYRAYLPAGIESDFPEHPSLLYRRPDQFVGRQIVMLRAKRN